jgi:hypothetical protein
MEETTKQALINVALITIATTLIMTTLTLLYGLHNLEQRIIWTEKATCESIGGRLINNKEPTLLCARDNLPVKTRRMNPQNNQLTLPPTDIQFPTTPTNYTPTAPDGQNHLPEKIQ